LVPDVANQPSLKVDVASCVQLFDSSIMVVVMSTNEIEQLRRSHAMAPLAASAVDQLLATAAGLAAQRDAIAAVLAELPTAFGDVRNALNEMARIIAGHADRQADGGSDSSSPLG
jgi:hypothetical protein